MSRKKSRTDRLRPLASLLAIGLSAPAFADPSVPFPTYQTGPQADGSWVLGDGQIVNPAGIQVDLGIRVRAKAIALNPNHASHTAAVLTMGAQQAVVVFDTKTGDVLQTYLPFEDNSGSYSGITYSTDGKYLMFSQDSSHVTFATVSASGLLNGYGHVSVPPNTSFISCFPNSPTGSYGVPCGTFYSPGTAYPGGVAFSNDGKSAYALLNQNNTLAKIDLTTMTQGQQIRVGNAPHSIVITDKVVNGHLTAETAYVSNEGGLGRHECGLPNLVRRHADRRRPGQRLRDHRHRFGCRSEDDESRQNHLRWHRFAPDRYGAVRRHPVGLEHL
jgi:DNA-binding beta-propeller fold protein YncE